MMSLIHILLPIQGQVGVHLRSGNIGMAQNGLRGTQISAILYHVGRTTVAQHVRTGITPCTRRRGANHLPDPLAGQFPGASAEE